jgi:hypothetical protein
MASGQGRFMSLDPGNAGADITDPQSWNMYSYALNNPLRYVDPFGLCSQDASGNFVDDDNGGAFQFSGPCVQGNTVTETAPPVETQNSETDDFLNTTFYADSFSSAFQVDVGQNVPPGTPQKYLGPLKQGLDNARAALKRKRCADFYGGQGPQTLDATRYRFLDMGNPTTGAATISPTEVFVNTNGAYMTYSPAIGQAGPFGRFWTQGQFRGFILLHELGHQLSNITDFQADLGSPLNQIQSQRVLAACF